MSGPKRRVGPVQRAGTREGVTRGRAAGGRAVWAECGKERRRAGPGGAAILARVGFERTSGLGQETGLGCFFLSYFKPLKLFEFKFKFEFKP